jgi:hypothetical protein
MEALAFQTLTKQAGHSFASGSDCIMSDEYERPAGREKRTFDVLTYAQVRQFVSDNNKAAGDGFSIDLITCQIWKESSFDPNASNAGHIGLLQMSSAAVDTVKANTPMGVHFTYPDHLTDPAKNIQCGTYYLRILFQTNSTVKDTLNAFGTGAGYVDNILACESCIQEDGDPTNATLAQPCLTAIHA